MSFQGKYQIQSVVNIGETQTFRARQISSGREVLVHHVVAGQPPSGQIELPALIFSFFRVETSAESKNFLDMGEEEGRIYVVTADVPQCLDLRRWLESVTKSPSAQAPEAPPPPAVGVPPEAAPPDEGIGLTRGYTADAMRPMSPPAAPPPEPAPAPRVASPEPPAFEKFPSLLIPPPAGQKKGGGPTEFTLFWERSSEGKGAEPAAPPPSRQSEVSTKTSEPTAEHPAVQPPLNVHDIPTASLWTQQAQAQERDRPPARVVSPAAPRRKASLLADVIIRADDPAEAPVASSVGEVSISPSEPEPPPAPAAPETMAPYNIAELLAGMKAAPLAAAPSAAKAPEPPAAPGSAEEQVSRRPPPMGFEVVFQSSKRTRMTMTGAPDQSGILSAPSPAAFSQLAPEVAETDVRVPEVSPSNASYEGTLSATPVSMLPGSASGLRQDNVVFPAPPAAPVSPAPAPETMAATPINLLPRPAAAPPVDSATKTVPAPAPAEEETMAATPVSMLPRLVAVPLVDSAAKTVPAPAPAEGETMAATPVSMLPRPAAVPPVDSAAKTVPAPAPAEEETMAATPVSMLPRPAAAPPVDSAAKIAPSPVPVPPTPPPSPVVLANPLLAELVKSKTPPSPLPMSKLSGSAPRVPLTMIWPREELAAEAPGDALPPPPAEPKVDPSAKTAPPGPPAFRPGPQSSNPALLPPFSSPASLKSGGSAPRIPLTMVWPTEELAAGGSAGKPPVANLKADAWPKAAPPLPPSSRPDAAFPPARKQAGAPAVFKPGVGPVVPPAELAPTKLNLAPPVKPAVAAPSRSPAGEYTRMIQNVKSLAGPLAPGAAAGGGSAAMASPAAPSGPAAPLRTSYVNLATSGTPAYQDTQPQIQPSSYIASEAPVRRPGKRRKAWVPILIFGGLFLLTVALLVFFALRH